MTPMEFVHSDRSGHLARYLVWTCETCSHRNSLTQETCIECGVGVISSRIERWANAPGARLSRTRAR